MNNELIHLKKRTKQSKSAGTLPAWVLGVLGCMCWPLAVADMVNEGLVARYTFEEDNGSIHDTSGNKHDAENHNCLLIKGLNGLCADVNGMGSGQYIDCDRVNVAGELTLSAWVYAYVWSDKEWSGIVYKSDATYGIRNYYKEPGRIHFQAGGVSLISTTRLKPLVWYHITAVFKPNDSMRIYINGILDASQKVEPDRSILDDSSPLIIGACARQFFSGRIDEVRVYNRALNEAEVKALFKTDGGGQVKLSDMREERAPPLLMLKNSLGTAEVKAYPLGGLELTWQGESYSIASTFSAPGEHCNAFSLDKAGGPEQENAWKPQIRNKTDRSFTIEARGASYRISRQVSFDGRIVEVHDTFTNLANQDIGIIISHQIATPQPLDNWYLYGVEKAMLAHDDRMPAINPTCFISQQKGSMGFVVEDDILRNMLEARVSAPMGTIAMGTSHFGLAKGATRTTSFTLYPLSGDYFDFLNRVRADWQLPPVSIPGPGGFLFVANWASDFYREQMAPHPEKFKEFLQKKHTNVFLLGPWYQYWSGFDYTDNEFKAIMVDAIRTIKAANPKAKCLACLETYYYFLPRSILGDTVPQKWEEWSKMPYEFGLPPTATAVIDKTPWKDSVWRDPQGNVMVSAGDPGPDAGYKTAPLCLLVYPEIGNHFFKLRMKEIEYLLDEVGFDGIYMDMFGYGQNFSYDKWDGCTVDISAEGEITRKYSHLAVVTAKARQAWLERIVAKGKIALVNFGQPNTKDLRKVPYFSIFETQSTGQTDFQSPIPDATAAAALQLWTPIGLGKGNDDDSDPSHLMTRARAHLRYGAIFYHYYLRTVFPDSSVGAYGPINQTFPITPVRLGKGFIEGRERIITTVSRMFQWPKPEPPRILLFDNIGREKPHAIKPERSGGGWKITVQLKDWQDIAVITSSSDVPTIERDSFTPK